MKNCEVFTCYETAKVESVPSVVGLYNDWKATLSEEVDILDVKITTVKAFNTPDTLQGRVAVLVVSYEVK